MAFLLRLGSEATATRRIISPRISYATWISLNQCMAKQHLRHTFRSKSVYSGNKNSNPVVGSANLDWSRLGFDFQPTAGFVKFTWANGCWDSGVFDPDPYLRLHVMSSAIHYGQAVFEGAKAHQCADGSVRLWAVRENARRMRQGCFRMMMPEVPESMFVRGCEWAVAGNLAYVPPYETKGAMYLRPYIFGHGPQLGLSPAPNFHFCVLAVPVSSYYGGGIKPIDALVVEKNDRAAPQGVGNIKAAGNYGSDILVSIYARGDGYPTVLYLDALTKQYVEEFSVSNFIGIKYARQGHKAKYVTPQTNTVLRSITNELLMRLASSADFDMDVERRPIHVDELDTFDEVAGCGTAVVVMGIKSLTYKGRKIEYKGIDTISKLYETYRAIQFGEAEDPCQWGTLCPPLSSVSTVRNVAAPTGSAGLA